MQREINQVTGVTPYGLRRRGGAPPKDKKIKSKDNFCKRNSWRHPFRDLPTSDIGDRIRVPGPGSHVIPILGTGPVYRRENK